MATPPLFVPAHTAHFRFAGRFDFSAEAVPTVIWAGSRIDVDFDGTKLALSFGDAVDQNFFDLTIDGRTETFGVPAGAGWRYGWPHTLAPTRHRLRLGKRSEAAAGHVRFAGIEIASDARTWAPSDLPHLLRMEFFGDSIMVGACNEDGDVDQWEDRRTHNHALSYTSLTASAFNSDYRCLAISGMGIVAGYVDVKAGQVWDKLYPRADSLRADLRSWQPDVAFVNFGENDDSFTRSDKLPFPSDYAAGYVALVVALRAAYPRTRLVLLRGGMFGGAKSPELRAAWEAAVGELEAGDAAISHFVFSHWSSNHPRVGDHRAMAEELTQWLNQQPWMTRILESCPATPRQP